MKRYEDEHHPCTCGGVVCGALYVVYVVYYGVLLVPSIYNLF
jgi:hypothetical protein